VQNFAAADSGWRSGFALMKAIELGCEFAPLDREIEQHVAHLAITRGLRDPIAFQCVGSAIFFGHPANPFARIDSVGGGKPLCAKSNRGSCGEKAWRREPRRNCLSSKGKSAL